VKLAWNPTISQCQIQDQICGYGGVLYRMPGNRDLESDDHESTVSRVACEAKCEETTINYTKKYSGVPLK